MTTRSTRRTLTFEFPFHLDRIDRQLSPGSYEVLTEEELIEGLSFSVYRRVSTKILVPAEFYKNSAIEMLDIDPKNLETIFEIDVSRRKNTNQ